MARKYKSSLTAKLTPENWQEVLDLKRLSVNEMIDVMGDLRQLEKLAKKVDGFLKEAVRARLPEDTSEYDTTFYHVKIEDRVRAGNVDTERLTEEFGEEWVNGYRKPPTEYKEFRIAPREQTE